MFKLKAIAEYNTSLVQMFAFVFGKLKTFSMSCPLFPLKVGNFLVQSLTEINMMCLRNTNAPATAIFFENCDLDI